MCQTFSTIFIIYESIIYRPSCLMSILTSWYLTTVFQSRQLRYEIPRNNVLVTVCTVTQHGTVVKQQNLIY